jgi:hypothetical protein
MRQCFVSDQTEGTPPIGIDGGVTAEICPPAMQAKKESGLHVSPYAL